MILLGLREFEQRVAEAFVFGCGSEGKVVPGGSAFEADGLFQDKLADGSERLGGIRALLLAVAEPLD